ncbi:MAG TPA: hypothetical protein VK452_12280 [Dissulfurispiraceae bacterium]|nr:hypothetical protein [Dissulfurispiraceae bacterium]
MEKKKIDVRQIMRQLENTLSASAFAEAGEHDAALQLMRADERVLLVLVGNESDTKSIKYAENFCDRMKAKLEVLCPSGIKDKAELSLASVRSKGINYSIEETDGCLKQAVLDITSAASDIRYVVVGSYHDLEAGCSNEANVLLDVRDIVRCPLVVVGA